MKSIEWIPWKEWAALTAEEYQRLRDYVKAQNKELGVRIEDEFSQPDLDQECEKDQNEFIEDMSLGGKRYRVKR